MLKELTKEEIIVILDRICNNKSVIPYMNEKDEMQERISWNITEIPDSIKIEVKTNVTGE